MTLLGFKTILHKNCRSGKNSERPAENSWVLDLCPANENIFQKVWLPYTPFCSIYVKAIDINRQFTLYKNICYHYTNEIDLIVPSLFVITARPQCALWSRTAISFLAWYTGGLYEFLFEAYLRIKFWKFSNSDVLLKLNIYKILLYDAYHICGVWCLPYLWDLNPPLYFHHTLMKQCQMQSSSCLPFLSTKRYNLFLWGVTWLVL